jgi:hypothetical protein
MFFTYIPGLSKVIASLTACAKSLPINPGIIAVVGTTCSSRWAVSKDFFQRTYLRWAWPWGWGLHKQAVQRRHILVESSYISYKTTAFHVHRTCRASTTISCQYNFKALVEHAITQQWLHRLLPGDPCLFRAESWENDEDPTWHLIFYMQNPWEGAPEVIETRIWSRAKRRWEVRW